jgi:hypothetical protein
MEEEEAHKEEPILREMDFLLIHLQAVRGNDWSVIAKELKETGSHHPIQQQITARSVKARWLMIKWFIRRSKEEEELKKEKNSS